MAGRLLSINEVADELGVSPRTVYRLIEDGHMPHTRVSDRRVGISPDQLESYLTSRSVDAVSPVDSAV